jgi:predicted aspartyl protease
MQIRLALLLALTMLPGCEKLITRTPEYHPEKAGTVDQALCLLGFKAVPLRELITGHHLVDVTLNGHTAAFVLDTGANASVLHAGYADELGLTVVRAPAAAIGLGGGPLKAGMARVERMEIDGIPIRQQRLLTADLGQVVRLLGPISGGKVYGIIGQDLMKEHRAVIDVARPILYLVAADRDPEPVAASNCRHDVQSAAGQGGA